MFSIFRFINIIWDNLQTFIHSKYSENNLYLFQLPAAGFYTQLVQRVFVRIPFYFTFLHFSNGSGLRLRCNVLRVCWEPRSWRRPPIRVKLPHNQSSLGGQTFVDFASGAGFFLNFIHHQYFIQSITLLTREITFCEQRRVITLTSVYKTLTLVLQSYISFYSVKMVI